MARPPQWTPENADRFKDRSVASAYHLRSPYPPAVFDYLRTLIAGSGLPLLDLGTGTGELARELAPYVMRVDAVDASAEMVGQGQTRPGGDHPSIRWIVESAEHFDSGEKYGLVTAGESLHWMDWDVVLPKLERLVTPGGFLALVNRGDPTPPWQESIIDVIATYSTSQAYESFDLVLELERRCLFKMVGRYETSLPPTWQLVDDYIESFHSRSSFSRAIMHPTAANEFDRKLREAVSPWMEGDRVPVPTVGTIVWGHPLGGVHPSL